MGRAPGGRHRRAAPGASVIGAGAGVLTAAAIVAALQTGLPAASGATALSADSRSVASQDAASPTAGPLQIPTIGVVAPAPSNARVPAASMCTPPWRARTTTIPATKPVST